MPIEQKSDGLLERIFDLLEESGPLKINIEDYLGILRDIPGLEIPEKYFAHVCGFCLHAKNSRGGFSECFSNKRAVNRLLQKRRRPLQGLCHLGVTDLVQPVLVEGVCVAGIYYGSVVVRGTEVEGQRRILEYCERRGLDAAPFLAEYERLPRIPRKKLPLYQERLKLVADMVARLIESSGIPLSRYRQEKDAQTARLRANFPLPLQAALRQLEGKFDRRITREDLARHVHCNANYLSGLFSTYLKMSMSDYLNRLRVERAKVLLKNSGLRMSEIAYAVGFEGQSYFNRRFKAITGVTPQAFRSGQKVDKRI